MHEFHFTGLKIKYIYRSFTGQVTLKKLQSHQYASKLGYMSHVRFIDMIRANLSTEFTWLSMVRDPVERFISRFRYRRRQWPAVIRQKRQHGAEFAHRWRNMTLNECLDSGKSADRFNDEVECGLENGDYYEPSPIVYFCGIEAYCSIHGSKEALKQAYDNIERHFTVIGVLEHLKLSLNVFEKKAANFVSGIEKIEIPHKKESLGPIYVSLQNRIMLRRKFELEFELYQYLVARLFYQAKRLTD